MQENSTYLEFSDQASSCAAAFAAPEHAAVATASTGAPAPLRAYSSAGSLFYLDPASFVEVQSKVAADQGREQRKKSFKTFHRVD